MTKSTRTMAEDLQRLAEALAEFQRAVDRVEHNLILIQATNQMLRDSHSPVRNGHLQ
jgi:hypothetical protein